MAAVSGLAPANVLHWIFDPLCGWCYGAAPLMAAAREVPGLAIELHGGGMMTGPNRRPITPQWRGHVMPHDRRIAALSGQVFGPAYTDGLLHDTTAVMDSAPPTTAVLAAQALQGRGLEMLERVQRAHYVDGLRVADTPVLLRLATEMGLDVPAFEETFARLAGEATQRHIAASRDLLARVGGQGFPTLVLALAGAAPQRLDIGPWLGQPEAWRAELAARVVAASR